jgi:hypothetical protein
VNSRGKRLLMKRFRAYMTVARTEEDCGQRKPLPGWAKPG